MVVENRIIEGCKKGKRNSFSKLYKECAPTMLGVCFRYSKTREEAEDILQEGFIKIFERISTYEGKGSFAGWMRRIMVNTAINHYKANLKHYYHEDVDKDDNINLKADEMEGPYQHENKINKEKLILLIQQLPHGYQMVFNLYVIDGLSHKEIADELGISINTSKTQLFKARKQLKSKLTIKEKDYSY